MDDLPPDNYEKGVRFGCGALFGGVVLFFILLGGFARMDRSFWLLVLMGALICGLFAVRFGDGVYRLFAGLLEWLRWW